MALPESLARAYRNAEYGVLAEPPFFFRIDEPSRPLDALLEAAGVQGAAFLTACNPRSERRSAEENAAAMRALDEALAAHPYAIVPGEGRDPEGRWPAEPSVLVLGLPRSEAEAIGRAFGQSAIVYVARGDAPRLVALE